MKQLCLILSIFLFASIANAGILGPYLEAALETIPGDEFLPIFVYLNEQANTQELSRELTAMRATRQHRHEVVVTELQRVAAETQESLQNFLNDKAIEGSVKDIKSFWIVNAFIVHANKEGILQIKDHPDVRDLTFANKVGIIEPVAQGPIELPGRFGVEPNISAVRADECWDMGITGEGTLVANLDTGVDGNHPALADRWRGNFAPPEECFFDAYDPNNHTPFDSGQHGTHTMGTITGLAEGTGDSIGVAPGALWIAAACVDYGPSGSIMSGFEYMVDPDGDPQTIDDVPDVLNNSWGDFHGPCSNHYYEAMDNCEAAGQIVVFSVGNGDQRDPNMRADNYYNSFTVGATSKYAPYEISGFSTRGPSPCAEGDLAIKPEVSAPGVDVRSSVPGNAYTTMDGTSMSCPHVAGVFALMRQVNPDLEVEQAKQILMDTCIDKGVAGEDNEYGWGFIDAYEAVMATYETMSSFEGVVKDLFTTENLRETTIKTLDDQTMVAISDNDGFYHLPTLPGEHYITAERFGYYDFVSDVSYEISAPETLQVDIWMSPLPAGVLSGYITDVQGNAIEGVQLTPVDVPMNPVYSDATGYYEFDPIPGDFTYGIEAWSGSFDTQIQEVSVPIDGIANLNFVMYPIQSFEEGEGEFYTEGGMVEWEWGTPTTEGGPTDVYHGDYLWGTDLDHLYNMARSYSLNTPQYHLYEDNNLYQLKFYHWYEMYDGWDGGNIQILVDGEEEWQIITPDGNYPDQGVVGLTGKPGYTGESGDSEEGAEWVVATFDLSDYVGQTVSFKFQFGSTNRQERGWFVDHIVVYGSEPPPSAINQNPFPTAAPDNFVLYQNYPNPFNPETEIRYNIPRKSHVELSIYDSEGKLIKEMVKTEQSQGMYSIVWNGKDNLGNSVPSGVYFSKMKAGGFEQSRKLILLK